MDKNDFKYLVDIGLAISFLLVTLTGIFKFPGIRENLAIVYGLIPRSLMALIHDWSGIVMAVLVLVHLILNWDWIKATTKSIFMKENEK